MSSPQYGGLSFFNRPSVLKDSCVETRGEDAVPYLYTEENDWWIPTGNPIGFVFRSSGQLPERITGDELTGGLADSVTCHVGQSYRLPEDSSELGGVYYVAFSQQYERKQQKGTFDTLNFIGSILPNGQALFFLQDSTSGLSAFEEAFIQYVNIRLYEVVNQIYEVVNAPMQQLGSCNLNVDGSARSFVSALDNDIWRVDSIDEVLTFSSDQAFRRELSVDEIVSQNIQSVPCAPGTSSLLPALPYDPPNQYVYAFRITAIVKLYPHIRHNFYYYGEYHPLFFDTGLMTGEWTFEQTLTQLMLKNLQTRFDGFPEQGATPSLPRTSGELGVTFVTNDNDTITATLSVLADADDVTMERLRIFHRNAQFEWTPFDSYVLANKETRIITIDISDFPEGDLGVQREVTYNDGTVTRTGIFNVGSDFGQPILDSDSGAAEIAGFDLSLLVPTLHDAIVANTPDIDRGRTV